MKTRTIYIGNLPLGSDYPVRIQSMTNTNTLDTHATVEQAKRMIDAGCEMVRITAPSVKEAENLYNIKSLLHQQNYIVPLIADIHFQPKAAEVAAGIVEKVRINPGNYVDRNIGKESLTEKEFLQEQQRITERIAPLIDICKAHKTVIRVGVNHGSLSERITNKFGNTPAGMVESAIEFINIIRLFDFHSLVLSMKSSNIKIMSAATRMLVERMESAGYDYPLHLGVTEAGDGEDGRIKSAIGIGSLLIDDIGNTIRVSLTEAPENEIPVAQSILQSCGLRQYKTEYIACPSCGRTQFDITTTLQHVKEKTAHLKHLKIAVMGCIVNGPGEMADAHYGYVGAGNGLITLYKGKEIVKKNIPEADAVDELLKIIEA